MNELVDVSWLSMDVLLFLNSHIATPGQDWNSNRYRERERIRIRIRVRVRELALPRLVE